MKTLIFIIQLMCCFIIARANNPYRNYLIASTASFRGNNQIPYQNTSTLVSIPKYQIPRAAIFCRMEDKVTRATKVWLKIGVQ